jgi:BirA family transcriptional regulator, biotin operon repressor / biotin---[acetyl-CoA-carboxylase] ligase
MSSTSLRDPMFSSSRLLFQNYNVIESTQDTAKKALPSLGPNQILALTATEQTQGRGTSGRSWMGQSGNVFLTVAFPSKEVPTTLTLLPLQVGILLAQRTTKLLKQFGDGHASVQVKWPNDVLVNHKKVAGILIESMVVQNNIWLLVGIGVNVHFAPPIPMDGPQRGRPSTSLQDNCQQQLPDTTAHFMAQDLAEAIVQWLEHPTSTSQKVIDDWKQLAFLGQPQVIRDTNETVIPIDIQKDGQLLVQLENGTTRLLVADYLF